MAKGHKKIVGSYCYKGNGCTSRFCEFCCNGDKYEEIEIEDEKIEDQEIEDEDEVIEEIDKLIECYELKLERRRNDRNCYVDDLSSALDTKSGFQSYLAREGTMHEEVGMIEKYNEQIKCIGWFILDLKGLKSKLKHNDDSDEDDGI